MYSHYQSCGWEHCVLIQNAWKFSSTLKTVGIMLNGSLDDYLIVECESLMSAETFCLGLSDIPNLSIWENGRFLKQFSKENNDG